MKTESVINQGVSFGLRLPVHLVIVGLVIVLYLFFKEKQGRVGLGMILLGGIINLTLRMLYGGVLDNLRLFGLLYNNWADYLIAGGVIIYIIKSVKKK